MSDNIFNIQHNYLVLLAEIEEEGGVLTPELEQEIESNERDFNNKVENYVKMIRHWEGEVNTIKNEIERLNDLKNRKEKSIETLEDNLSEALQLRNIDKLTVGTNKLSFRKSETLEVTDPEGVPEEFIKSVTTESIDKTALKKWIKDGNTTDSAYIKENKNLQIK